MKNLPIKGIRSLSLVDYPGCLSSVVFFGGCNFKCPFCHNYDIAVYPEQFPNLDTATILSELQRRKKLNDGVVLTGGEPTLVAEIIPFAKTLKAMGYKIKLDTNGYNPFVLQEFVKDNIADFISMDIKSSLQEEAYSKAAGVKINLDTILKSIGILKDFSGFFEFRTTVIHNFVSFTHIEEIVDFLKPYQFSYYLQGANLSLKDFSGPALADLEHLAKQLQEKGFQVFAR